MDQVHEQFSQNDKDKKEPTGYQGSQGYQEVEKVVVDKPPKQKRPVSEKQREALARARNAKKDRVNAMAQKLADLEKENVRLSSKATKVAKPEPLTLPRSSRSKKVKIIEPINNTDDYSYTYEDEDEVEDVDEDEGDMAFLMKHRQGIKSVAKPVTKPVARGRAKPVAKPVAVPRKPNKSIKIPASGEESRRVKPPSLGFFENIF
jgi:hypothetical protein